MIRSDFEHLFPAAAKAIYRAVKAACKGVGCFSQDYEWVVSWDDKQGEWVVSHRAKGYVHDESDLWYTEWIDIMAEEGSDEWDEDQIADEISDEYDRQLDDFLEFLQWEQIRTLLTAEGYVCDTIDRPEDWEEQMEENDEKESDYPKHRYWVWDEDGDIPVGWEGLYDDEEQAWWSMWEWIEREEDERQELEQVNREEQEQRREQYLEQVGRDE